jgi:hypothetical protein
MIVPVADARPRPAPVGADRSTVNVSSASGRRSPLTTTAMFAAV